MLMFPNPVTAHWPHAAWEREKALPDKTLPGSKCFVTFIIILKNSNSTQRKFCLVQHMWGRTDAELYFSPHHSFCSAKQTVWQGSTATGTQEGQPEQQKLCPHIKVIWCKRRSRSVGQNYLPPELVRVLEGESRVVPPARVHVCTGSVCRTGSDSWVWKTEGKPSLLPQYSAETNLQLHTLSH